MKKLLVICTLLIGLNTQAAGIATPEGNTTSRGGVQTIIAAVGSYQDLQQTIREKNVALNFEETLEFPSLKEIERLETEIRAKEEQLKTLQDQFSAVINRSGNQNYDESDEALVENLIQATQSEITTLKQEQTEYEATYQGRKERQQSSIRSLKQELEDLNEEVVKQRKIIELQVVNFGSYVLFFVGLALLFLLLKLFGRVVINRVTHSFSEPRRKALIRLNNITFNVLLALVILGVVFSQFVNFLPFLAILGTGLAFAVRDTISSFIAWFVVGTERGYKSGDIIQIGDMTGQVLEIKPLLTALIDLSPGWNTGKIISMPNKIIFEEKIYNHSRCGGLFQQTLQFLLTEDSNIDEAKKLLLETIQAQQLTDEASSQKQLRKTVQCQYSDKDLTPHVWIESSIHGLELKSRFLCQEDEQEVLFHRIQESFTKKVQQNDKVHFQFVEVGRHSRLAGSGANESEVH